MVNGFPRPAALARDLAPVPRARTRGEKFTAR